jgi:hypothetical protein
MQRLDVPEQQHSAGKTWETDAPATNLMQRYSLDSKCQYCMFTRHFNFTTISTWAQVVHYCCY